MVRFALFALAADCVSTAGIAQKGKRIALLVGNQSYSSEIGRLANPHNWASLVSQIHRHEVGVGALLHALSHTGVRNHRRGRAWRALQ
jgi:hypothetical protein